MSDRDCCIRNNDEGCDPDRACAAKVNEKKFRKVIDKLARDSYLLIFPQTLIVIEAVDPQQGSPEWGCGNDSTSRVRTPGAERC
jgi:hypothetical protein